MRSSSRRSRAPAGRRLSAVAGGAFSPSSIASLTLWLDPSFGLYQERTGASASTPAVAANDPVGTWRARTGQNFVAPSDAARPTLQFLGTNPSLLFDGVDDVLSFGSGAVFTALGHAVYAKVRLVTLGDYEPVAITRQIASGWRLCVKLTVAEWGTYQAADKPAGTSISAGADDLLGMNGGAFRRSLFGVLLDDGTYNASEGSASTGGLWMDIGAEASAARFMNAYLGKLVVCTAALSAAERANLEAYLL